MAAYLSTELGGSANQTSAPVGYKPRATVYGRVWEALLRLEVPPATRGVGA